VKAVGVAASITGIVGFTGQALNGLPLLESIIEAIKDGHQAVATILSDIQSLEGTFGAVKDLLCLGCPKKFATVWILN
jgi:hypothetical protein